MPELEIRPIEPDEYDAYDRLDDIAFAQVPNYNSPEDWARDELDRAYGAFEGGELVGNGRLYSMELTLPGGAIVPAGNVSWIAVSPTHRRRGILRQMMAALHDDAAQRGEPVTILTASEGGIYGRFGYGVASWRMGATVHRHRASLARPVEDDGRMRYIDLDPELGGVAPLLAPVYDRARRARAGMVSRPATWWRPMYVRYSRAATPFLAVHSDASGNDDGFVLYTIERRFDGGLPVGVLRVADLQATSARARVLLWQFVLAIDLVATVEADNLPVDDPLRFLLNDPRQLRIDFVNDMMWLRLGDPLALLRARSFAPGAAPVVVEVHGPDATPTRLLVGPEGVARSRRRADLVMGLAELGALSLGGTACCQLAQAGRVEEVTSGAAANADRLFASYPPPATLSAF